MAICGEFNRLTFCKHGDDGWTSVSSTLKCFSDILFYEGKFYAVTFIGKLVVCDADCLPTVVDIQVKQPKLTPSFRLYHVETAGGLVLVERCYKGRGLDLLDYGEIIGINITFGAVQVVLTWKTEVPSNCQVIQENQYWFRLPQPGWCPILRKVYIANASTCWSSKLIVILTAALPTMPLPQRVYHAELLIWWLLNTFFGMLFYSTANSDYGPSNDAIIWKTNYPLESALKGGKTSGEATTPESRRKALSSASNTNCVLLPKLH
ncbi:unnamed protein product [Ilex paraguariensis]|uniref:KIB1-4 beta-propeller domain-containing protein n=1 Tax=Ilex paraguariensis TaxID=185542 RepID=A0ABC8ST71_9AQUA